MAVKKEPPAFYHLKITLEEIEPPIWRRLRVPANLRLSRLHDALQTAMGWTNSHLHEFGKDGQRWGEPAYDTDDPPLAESRKPLSSLLKAEGDSMAYIYDFGDYWRHEVVLEKISPGNRQARNAVCLEGARRCPPEDVGGTFGYQEFLEAILDPAHEEHANLVVWSGGSFDPGEFDLKAVNRRLARGPR